MIYRDFASLLSCVLHGPRYDSIAIEFELPARVGERSKVTCDLVKGVVFDTRAYRRFSILSSLLNSLDTSVFKKEGGTKRGTTEVKVVRSTDLL